MPKLPPGVEPVDLSLQAQELAAPRLPVAQRLRNAWDALAGRPFGPGRPVEPSLPRKEQENPPAPRQFQYPPLVNIQTAPRREYQGLTPFEQLRNLASLYDVAAMCIAARIEELQGMGWSIVPLNKKRKDLQDECEAATAFFKHPDRLDNFPSWVGMILYELLTIDALTLYRRPDLGGRLYALEAVDGATIKPLIDDRGRVVAYQQIINGFAETEFSRRELLYKPRFVRTLTPYGFPPTEWIILRVNQALRKQTFDLAWFTDGNIPDMVATPPEGSLSPEQVEAFEVNFNAIMEGQDKARRKVRFVPWDMNFKLLKEFSYETALDEWMLRVTCAAYSVPPQELGFTYDVNRATAEMQEAVNERKGLKPLATWLKKEILDDEISRLEPVTKPKSISLPGAPTKPVVSPFSLVEWQWQFGDKADDLIQAQTHGMDIQNGVITPDESRVMRYGDTLDGPAPGRQEPPPSPFGVPANFFNSSQSSPVIKQIQKTVVQPDQNSGVMVAFFIPPETARRLALPSDSIPNGDVIPADALHVTLAYLDEATDMTVGKEEVASALNSFAAANGSIAGRLSGVGRFRGEDGRDALYASFDSPDLAEFRQHLVDALERAGAQVDDGHGFTPHITLAYIPSREATPDLELPDLEIRFGEIALAWAGSVDFLPLKASSSTAKIAAVSEVAAGRFFQGEL